jgi:hypothetical protein
VSIGLQFIRKCIENASSVEFRRVADALYDGEAEQQAYQFVADYFRQYSQFPSLAVCVSNGHNLPPPTEPSDYYVARMRQRHAFTVVQDFGDQIRPFMARRDMSQIPDMMRAALHTMTSQSTAQEVQTLGDLAREVMDDYTRAHMRPGMQGITLGYPILDRLTNGAEGGDIITLVARPNKGKSWLLTHMAREAWRAGRSVLLVSMEMTGKQMARRVIGLDAGINPNYIREGRLSNFAHGSVLQTISDIRTGAPFHVIQGSFNKSLDTVDAAIQEFGPDIIYIDASYLMAPSKRNRQNGKQHEVLAAVGTEMKEMAMARQRPFVQTVQFNREADRAEEQSLGHIGGTDVVGQISTIVVGIQPGPPPAPERSRRLTLLKNRENPLDEFLTNFLFNPPNFRYRPPEDVAPEDNNGVEAEWSI